MIELAVFGAVLFYIIGAMTINYIAGSFQQNAQLQSMRRAMLASYLASKEGSGKRSSGSFLIFEDRLTGEFGKFGAVDRQPIVASGSGMMTAQLMQVTDWGDPDSIPETEVIVNGESFVFRTSGYAAYVMALKSGNVAQIIQIDASTPSSARQEHFAGAYCQYDFTVCDPENDECGAAGPCVSQYYVTTQDTIEEVIRPDVLTCLPENGRAGGYVISCNPPISSETTEQLQRLAREWTNSSINRYVAPKDGVPGHRLPPFFTAMAANDPKFTPVPNESIAFNFTRKPTGLVFPFGSGALRPAWRWSWDKFWEPLSTDTDAQKKLNIKQKIIDQEAPFFSYDVDADLVEESLYDVKDVTGSICNSGLCVAAYMVKVQESNAADIDPTKGAKDFADPNQRPGIRPEFRIYGKTSGPDEGGALTYLDVKEGKLFSDGKQVAVSELRKNQYDVVERVYQLNVNMADVGGFLANNPHVANGCGGTNFQGSCLDPNTKTLYIRSRLSDQRGRKWITDLDNRTWNDSLGGE